MGLENPTYLNDLVEANPVGLSDFRHEGDDHLRGIKGALKRTLPFFNGRIWRRRNVTAGGPLNTTDNSALVRVSQAVTLIPADASVLGEWMCFVRADGGQVTINPAQNINGVGSINIPSGYTGILFCDGTEFFMSLVFSDVPPTVKPFVTGTRMFFQQTNAPIAWTKVTTAAYNDAAMRIVTGTAATGGADAFTTTFTAGKNTGGHALTIAEMPSHTHGYGGIVGGAHSNVDNGGGVDEALGLTTSPTGGGATHLHTMPSMNVKYADAIIASID